jgi:hypothetical protein
MLERRRRAPLASFLLGQVQPSRCAIEDSAARVRRRTLDHDYRPYRDRRGLTHRAPDSRVPAMKKRQLVERAIKFAAGPIGLLD